MTKHEKKSTVVTVAIVIAFLAPATIVYGEENKTGPIPQSFTITLTAAELGYIGQALVERPFKDVRSLISKIEKQVDEQMKAFRQGNPPKEK